MEECVKCALTGNEMERTQGPRGAARTGEPVY